MFGADSSRLEPHSTDFSSSYLTEVRSQVKADVRRRRSMTRLPLLVASGFGALVWVTFFQGSTLSLSAPVEVIGAAAPAAGQVAVGGEGNAQAPTGASADASGGVDGSSNEPDNSPTTGGLESTAAIDAPSDDFLPPRPVPVFDYSTVVQDPTEVGPSSPPPAADYPLLVPETGGVENGSSNDSGTASPVGSNAVSSEDEAERALDTLDASPEFPSTVDNPSIDQGSSGDGATPVLIELAPGSAVDPDNPLTVTLRLRVVDPDGSVAGACGTSINWSDGNATGDVCDIGCSSEAGGGVDETLTFEHTYDRPGIVQVLATVYTGAECYGNSGTYLLSLQVGELADVTEAQTADSGGSADSTD